MIIVFIFQQYQHIMSIMPSIVGVRFDTKFNLIDVTGVLSPNNQYNTLLN